MRRIVIEFGKGMACNVIDEYGRHCDELAFDEMLGQVVSMAHPQLGRPHYQMHTDDEWEALRAKWRAARQDISKEIK